MQIFKRFSELEVQIRYNTLKKGCTVERTL